jgi:predicted short-subunit dehydrogenase-like oxidoreductase (DUF2520 family)
MRVVIIGSGSLATQFGTAMLKNPDFEIVQIFSRTPGHAEELGTALHVSYTSDVQEIDREADIYFYAVNDSAISTLAKKNKVRDAIHIHMSGSTPMSVFRGITSKYGVFYPLQTFSKNRSVNFKEIPIFLESSSADVQNILLKLGKSISDKVYIVNSEQRKRIHLAAVFACNFTNFMYDCAYDSLRNTGIGFELLHPLIQETAEKVKTMTPRKAQTGPAVRYDSTVIDKHLELLKKRSNLKLIYTILTNSINKRHKKRNSNSNFIDKLVRRYYRFLYSLKPHH